MKKAVSLFALIAFASAASAQDIPSGCDCWITEPDTRFEIPDLPPGFFGPGSDPFPATVIDIEGVPLPQPIIDALCPLATEMETVWVDPHGTPVAPNDAHAVGTVQVPVTAPIDTIVCRPDDVTFGGVGTPELVPIEIIELSLKSVAPIVVTFNGGMMPTLFDVFITEDGLQAVGQMTLLPAVIVPNTSSSGGSILDSLPINFQVQFQQVSSTFTVGLGGLSIDFTGTTGNFAFSPASGPVGLPGLGFGGIALLALAVVVVGFFMIRRRKAVPSAG